MSFSRLPFLYPQWFRQASYHEISLAACSLHPPHHGKHHRIPTATICTSTKRRQEAFAQRYGPAAEPQSPPPSSSLPPKPQDEKSLAGTIEQEIKPPMRQDEQQKPESPVNSNASSRPLSEKIKAQPEESGDRASEDILQDSSKRPLELDTTKEIADAATAAKKVDSARKSIPMETVLQMGPPTTEKPEEHRALHLQAPPYVHHFDTFTLVKDLERGGFTADQSVTIMKAIRGLLAVNLDVAKESLVSKSDIENETYLFRAACSELRTEILNTRKSSSTKTRTQLSHLQHTYDILSQRVSQETLALKDDLRGMLNDRRISSREQHQNRDSEISELNNAVSVRLNSGSKSEVEGLRWVLTRRAAMAIGGMALLILGSLRYSSYKLHEQEIQARKLGGAGQSSSSSSGSGGGGGGHTVSSREMGTQTSESAVTGVDKAENVGYVSLG
ncbi:hypothetical protein ACLMJK_001580 [Lecanora helva]